MRISTQNIACSQRQINTCHTSFSYILWAYGEHIMSKWNSRTSDQFIWLVSEKKTEAVKAYLIKNSKGEAGEKKPKNQKTEALKTYQEQRWEERERERERDRPTDRQTDKPSSGYANAKPKLQMTHNYRDRSRNMVIMGQIIVYIYFVIVTMFLVSG